MKTSTSFSPPTTPWLRTLAAVWLGANFAFICAGAVKVWEKDSVIPTYLAGDPEPNPMFYFGRASQGAEGRVYPYPLYDTLTSVKSNKTYRLVYLENEYVRIGILPEIGGRLFEAVDKSNGYDFIYHQHVIKPALIGLIGAWISGGIEWNIPHHHRATTFLPVQHRIEANSDGSKTVWVGELELRQRMRWAVGYTLRSGKSYLECSVRIVNRTPVVNTMLCFANVAVHVNDNYQVIYPPSTRFVTFHSKREFTTWPIATTRYNGADFTKGVDVSWYSNHFSANSMFAWNYEDDFFAGYDHGKNAGIMSVADHFLVPGKKFWTWGNGPRGRMWDKILTDTDGPYIELMVGAYSDNQPDYSWLHPYETRAVNMFWYPFRDIGGVKKANLEAAVNLETSPDGSVSVGFCTTAAYRSAMASLKLKDRVLFEQKIAIDPGKPFRKVVALPAGADEHDLRAALTAGGKELVAYSPVRLEKAEMPEPVQGPPAPKEIKTVEELYLAGQRLEQFHNPNLRPEPYWDEALERDLGDGRVNTVVGIRKLKQARYPEAEAHFRKALARLSANYTTPKDAEPSYYLGVTLQAQNKFEAARDAFSKAAWSEAWRSPAWFALAEIATSCGNFSTALDDLERSLAANALNLRALTLKSAVLRHTGRTKEALAVLEVAITTTDPLDVRLMAERWLAGEKDTELAATLRDHPATGLETAAEFADAGLWQDGVRLCTYIVDAARDPARVSPLVFYYLADFAEQLGDTTKAAEYRRRAAECPADYVFPFQWEAIAPLRHAIAANPNDARARYYLGNLLYEWQPEEAVKLWEQAVALAPEFAIVHRNLAAAYAHQKPKDLARAVEQLEQAVNAPVKYPLHFAELDELYAGQAVAPEKRLALLERNHDIVCRRDDALSRELGLKVFAGKFDEAIRLMTGRKFSVWEGGSLEVANHWVSAHLLRGQECLAAHQAAAALADFQAANNIPDNLPNDRAGGRNAEIAYWLALAFEAQGDADKARQSWQEAAANVAPSGPRRGSGGRLSDRQVQTYFQALSKRKLGQDSDAESILRGLIETAERALEQETEPAAGAESGGERQSPRNPMALAHYVAGLGHLGLGEKNKARTEFELALKASPDLLGAKGTLLSLK